MTANDLKAERLNRGKSVEALAAEIGVPVHVLRHAERGGVPRPGNAAMIAAYFELRVTDLWYFDANPEGEAA